MKMLYSAIFVCFDVGTSASQTIIWPEYSPKYSKISNLNHLSQKIKSFTFGINSCTVLELIGTPGCEAYLNFKILYLGFGQDLYTVLR